VVRRPPQLRAIIAVRRIQLAGAWRLRASRRTSPSSDSSRGGRASSSFGMIASVNADDALILRLY
jgi:hypothetical protein